MAMTFLVYLYGRRYFNFAPLSCYLGLPWWLSGKESFCNAGDVWDAGSIPGSGRREWQPALVFLPGESHGRRSLAGYSPQACKEADTTEETEQARVQGMPSTLRCGVGRRSRGAQGHHVAVHWFFHLMHWLFMQTCWASNCEQRWMWLFLKEASD